MTRNILTYGTFDLFHVGHIRLLERLRSLGDRLVVGVSTDEFNAQKGKRSLIPYEHRAEILRQLRMVDLVIPEESWDQKINDIRAHDIHVFGIGDDWQGKFDFLKPHCEVVYLPRTPGVTSTALRSLAMAVDKDTIDRLRDLHVALDTILRSFE